jgi:hypothetical protein
MGNAIQWSRSRPAPQSSQPVREVALRFLDGARLITFQIGGFESSSGRLTLDGELVSTGQGQTLVQVMSASTTPGKLT